MKRVFLIIFTCLLFITGCSSEKLDFNEIYKKLEDEYKGYVEVNGSTLEGVYGVELDKFKSYLVVMRDDSATSQMYAIFEANDSMDDALYEVEYFIDNYEKTWLNGYFPKEEKLVKDSVLETYGKYIIFVVNEDTDKIMNLIKED